MLALINPTVNIDSFELYGEWAMLSDGIHAGASVIKTVSGIIEIPQYSVIILRK